MYSMVYASCHQMSHVGMSVGRKSQVQGGGLRKPMITCYEDLRCGIPKEAMRLLAQLQLLVQPHLNVQCPPSPISGLCDPRRMMPLTVR